METASGQKVYFGSSIYSEHSGELSANTTVIVKWAEKLAGSSGVWYYIAFGTNNSKQGYVSAGSGKNAGTVGNPLVLGRSQRYMHANCSVYYSALSASAEARVQLFLSFGLNGGEIVIPTVIELNGIGFSQIRPPLRMVERIETASESDRAALNRFG